MSLDVLSRRSGMVLTPLRRFEKTSDDHERIRKTANATRLAIVSGLVRESDKAH